MFKRSLRISPRRKGNLLPMFAILLLMLTACAAPASPIEEAAETLPALNAVTLAADEPLRVVVSTNLVADLVARVGGDAIELITLMPVGVDPHSYTTTPQDLRTLNEAHVIFVNGLGLEESLLPVLEELDSDTPVVSVNAGVATRSFGSVENANEEDGEAQAAEEEGADPHTWLSVPNVMQWAETVATTLGALDPPNAATYTAAAQAYHGELAALDAELRGQIDTLPVAQRKLVTDHDEFGYFAADYGFEIVGAVIPAYSTTAQASAQELAALQDLIAAEAVPAIFVGTSVNPDLAKRLASDLGIAVVTLYTASLSEANGPAPDYPTLMRYNVNAIVTALSE